MTIHHGEEIKLLDHGYIKLIESWGSDERIIESARMSTAKGFLGWGPTCPHEQPGEEHVLRSAAFHPEALLWTAKLAEWQREGEKLYQEGLRDGVPKELARLAMSVGRYSTMRASANVRGRLHLFGLRMAKNAQEEFRVYAEAAGMQLLSQLFPRTWHLFAEKSGLA